MRFKYDKMTQSTNKDSEIYETALFYFGIFKKKIKDCWMLTRNKKNRTPSHLFLSPLSFSVLSQFPPHSNAKTPLFGESKKNESRDDFIHPRRYFNGFNHQPV